MRFLQSVIVDARPRNNGDARAGNLTANTEWQNRASPDPGFATAEGFLHTVQQGSELHSPLSTGTSVADQNPLIRPSLQQPADNIIGNIQLGETQTVSTDSRQASAFVRLEDPPQGTSEFATRSQSPAPGPALPQPSLDSVTTAVAAGMDSDLTVPVFAAVTVQDDQRAEFSAATEVDTATEGRLAQQQSSPVDDRQISSYPATLEGQIPHQGHLVQGPPAAQRSSVRYAHDRGGETAAAAMGAAIQAVETTTEITAGSQRSATETEKNMTDKSPAPQQFTPTAQNRQTAKVPEWEDRIAMRRSLPMDADTVPTMHEQKAAYTEKNGASQQPVTAVTTKAVQQVVQPSAASTALPSVPAWPLQTDMLRGNRHSFRTEMTEKRPQLPKVQIGQIDVIIEAPLRSASSTSAPASPTDLASRHYLRRL